MAAQGIAIPAHYEFLTFKQQTVGTSEAALTPLALTDAVKKAENIFVQAAASNTGKIYLAQTGLTAGGAAIELAAGANLNLPSNDVAWFAIADAANQKLNIVYCQGIS